LGRPVVFVIDMLNDCFGHAELERMRAALCSSINRLTALARAKGFPVVWVRQEFEPDADGFVVSPENAREQLATFIKRAKKSLVIWDPKLADPQMLRLLTQRAKMGVDIRVIGKVAKRAPSTLRAQKSPIRLHVRAAVRDCSEAFVGSQSLRSLELDGRREVGILTKDPKVVKAIADLFEGDWAKTDMGQKELKVIEKELSLAEVC